MNKYINYEKLIIIYNSLVSQAQDKKDKTESNVGRLMWESYISGITDFKEVIEEIGVEENTNE